MKFTPFKLVSTSLLLAALVACGGGYSAGDPEVLLQSHPVASNAGPMDTMAVPPRRMAALVRILDASSFFNWAESAYPNLFEALQSNKTLDVWTYRYYPKTDIYLGTNTNGDVLGLVGKGGGDYNSYPLGKITNYGCLVYPSDCITINAAPVAKAGVAQNVVPGSSVTLDGSGSSDADGDSLTYAWTLASKPAGSAAALTNATAVVSNFVADKAGTYVATLLVKDGKLNSAASTITVSVAQTISASGKITDSGIKANQCYAAGSDALVSCTSAAALALNDQQDGMVGRDVSNPDSSDGKLGFSYSKLDASGNTLPASASTWVCVKDNITGLTWEIKTADGGMRDRYRTYTNYDNNRNGDASAFAAAVNVTNLCGHADWRVPTIRELQGIVDYSKDYTLPGDGPAIDGAWFINTIAVNYWSSSAFAGDASQAWNVDFKCGTVGYCSRSSLYAVRLVR